MKKDKNIIKALLFMNVFFFATLIASAQCPTVIWNLTAGQWHVWGTLSVTNDNEYIYVTYRLDPTKTSCTSLGMLHLWIGNDLDNLPVNKKGIPIPGHFPFHYYAADLLEYTFKIHYEELSITGVDSADDLCNMTLYIFAHGEGCDETFWGGDIPVNVGTPGKKGNEPGRWYYYGIYNWCCENGPPPICRRETAFAKGGWVFVTSNNCNPEKLPSLKLINCRWGWAINLTSTGTTTYDIWAGAGLNNTANGTLVGTLTINWDGSIAEVKYELFNGYLLREVHLYAGDGKPTTTAPGQYGNQAYFNPGQSSHTFKVSLTDSDGDGVWLIAHAIVEFVCK